MPNEHVHEVTLPTGEVVRTGPVIADEPVEGGEAPAGLPAATEPVQGLRATPAAKVRTVNVPDPAEQQAKEAEQAKQALASRNLEMLPTSAKQVWKRMYTSTCKVFTGDDLEAYATTMAWRAIVQKYGLPWPPDLDPPDTIGRSTLSALAGTRTAAREGGRKAYVYGVTTRQGGAYIVPCSSNREDALAKYTRIVSVPLPGTSGASIRVGLWSGGRNIIDVSVPSSVVWAQPGEEENNNKAHSWVVNNWRNILYTAKDWLRPHEKLVQPVRMWSRNSKLVTDPARAKEQISFGPALVPFEVDLQGQYATEDEVERVAHEFLPRNGKIGLMHGKWTMDDGQPVGLPVESYIVRGAQSPFPDRSWVLGIKWHDRVWPDVVSGKLKGLSIGGAWGAETVQLFAEVIPYEQVTAA